MINVIVVITVVLLVVLAVYIQVRNKGSSCGCGDSSSSSSSCGRCSLSSGGCGVVPTFESNSKSSNDVIKTLMLDVEGMHCEKCQNSVSGALNSLDGVSATVDLAKNCATVVLSKDVPETMLKEAVADKGFEVTAVRTI